MQTTHPATPAFAERGAKSRKRARNTELPPPQAGRAAKRLTHLSPTTARKFRGGQVASILGQLQAAAADSGRMLSFQRLDVYQRAIEFLSLVTDIAVDLPKGNAERADQLVRAAESVLRNIAEGAGRWSKADSAKHYRIARGEAMECAASLDVLKLRRLIADRTYERGIRLLEGVVGMLTKMT